MPKLVTQTLHSVLKTPRINSSFSRTILQSLEHTGCYLWTPSKHLLLPWLSSSGVFHELTHMGTGVTGRQVS